MDDARRLGKASSTTVAKLLFWAAVGAAHISLLPFEDDPDMRVFSGLWIYFSALMVAVGIHVAAEEEGRGEV